MMGRPSRILKWIVYASAMVNFALGISLPIAMSSMFIDWQDTFQVSRAHTVVIQSTTVSIVFGGAMIPGFLMDRFGARVTVLLGSFMASTACFISCFATSVNFLIMSTGVLGGLGFCFIHMPAIPTVTKIFSSKYQGIAVSVCTCGAAMGNMLFPFLYRHLVHNYSWRGTYLFISAISMQTFITGFLMTTDERNYITAEKPTDCEETVGMKANLKPEEKTNDEVALNSETEIDHNHGLHESDDHFDEHADECQKELNPLSVELKQHENKGISNTSCLQRYRVFLKRTKDSKWKFILDPMYLFILAHACVCMASILAFILTIMDFARSKGYPDDSTGVFFLFLMFFTSLAGRLITGFLNMSSFMHSIDISGYFASLGSVALIVLGSATEYAVIIGGLVAAGISIGSLVAIDAKRILDVDSVSQSNFHLALGLGGSIEGLFDILLPVLIGYSVDMLGSYTLILHVLGSLSLFMSIALLVFKAVSSRRSKRES